MTTTRLILTLAVSLYFLSSGCKDQGTTEVTTISLKNTQIYQYPTVGGDEEAATIVSQAKHYTISEIRRNQQTNWIAVYFYQPSPGFVGSDYVELEIQAGSDGASQPTKIKRIAFNFQISN